MTTQILLEIASKFDNVKFIKYPNFMHVWKTDLGVWKNEPISVDQNKFKHSEFLDYLEEQRDLGNSVYILENSDTTMYDAMSFEPILGLRMKSIHGVIKKSEINEETLVTNEFDKFKYLLIR